MFKPMSLATIMKESGNRPPMMVPNKGIYLGKDLHRLRSFYSIPLNSPANVQDVLLNKGSLSALRLLTSVQMTQSDLTERLSRELWMRIWSRDQDITANESLLEALKAIGVPDDKATKLIQSIKDPKVIERLKEVTNEALSYGTFGAPTIVVTDAKNEKQLLFGSDRMELLASILGEKYEGPLVEFAAAKL